MYPRNEIERPLLICHEVYGFLNAVVVVVVVVVSLHGCLDPPKIPKITPKHHPENETKRWVLVGFEPLIDKCQIFLGRCTFVMVMTSLLYDDVILHFLAVD